MKNIIIDLWFKLTVPLRYMMFSLGYDSCDECGKWSKDLISNTVPASEVLNVENLCVKCCFAVVNEDTINVDDTDYKTNP